MGSTGRSSPALDRAFFARSTLEVAAALVGTLLVSDRGTPEEVVARVVEVEAYLGREDPASHAHRGPTPRAAIMFGPPGHLYVYLSYGVHFCANVVCEPEGSAGAVLLRAAAVSSGEDVVRRRRGPGPRLLPAATLLRGPGNLGAGLGLSLADNGLDLCAPGARLSLLAGDGQVHLAVGPRVGITRAADRPLRLAWAGHPAVSHPAGLVAQGRFGVLGP
jgi:DNA-3-methyladenine glycosylase